MCKNPRSNPFWIRQAVVFLIRGCIKWDVLNIVVSPSVYLMHVYEYFRLSYLMHLIQLEQILHFGSSFELRVFPNFCILNVRFSSNSGDNGICCL